MSLNIKPSTSIERDLLAQETILNTTDKISKISSESVFSGITAGMAKISGKAEKDIILAVSQLFPDSAFGDQLDQVASNFGVPPRLGATASSTFVRISAVPGTQYLANTNVFPSSGGVQFALQNDVIIPSFGFTYAKVVANTTGAVTNVDALTISQVSPIPNGHLNVVNEYRADGGRDIESDEIFRVRIKNGSNILARGTIAMLEQKFMLLNPNVLKVYNQGNDLSGSIILSIATQNGADLTQTEFDALLAGAAESFSLNELRPFGSSFVGIKLIPVPYGFVDVSFRCLLDNSFDPDEVRKQIQVNMSKYVDPRFFDPTVTKVDWTNLLDIVKNTPGMKYVPDEYFYPRTDIFFANIIPRIRGFLMLDMDGGIIQNFQGTLSPVFYPNLVDFSFQATVLNDIP